VPPLLLFITQGPIKVISLRIKLLFLLNPKTNPNQTKPNQTKPNQTKPNPTQPNKTKQNKTKQNKTKQLQTQSLYNRCQFGFTFPLLFTSCISLRVSILLSSSIQLLLVSSNNNNNNHNSNNKKIKKSSSFPDDIEWELKQLELQEKGRMTIFDEQRSSLNPRSPPFTLSPSMDSFPLIRSESSPSPEAHSVTCSFAFLQRNKASKQATKIGTQLVSWRVF